MRFFFGFAAAAIYAGCSASKADTEDEETNPRIADAERALAAKQTRVSGGGSDPANESSDDENDGEESESGGDDSHPKSNSAKSGSIAPDTGNGESQSTSKNRSMRVKEVIEDSSVPFEEGLSRNFKVRWLRHKAHGRTNDDLFRYVSKGNMKSFTEMATKGKVTVCEREPSTGESLLFPAARFRNNAEFIVILETLKGGCPDIVNSTDNRGRTALIVATERGENPRIVETLLKEGADAGLGSALNVAAERVFANRANGNNVPTTADKACLETFFVLLENHVARIELEARARDPDLMIIYSKAQKSHIQEILNEMTWMATDTIGTT